MSSDIDVQNKMLVEKRRKMITALKDEATESSLDPKKAYIKELRARKESLYNRQVALIAYHNQDTNEKKQSAEFIKKIMLEPIEELDFYHNDNSSEAL